MSTNVQNIVFLPEASIDSLLFTFISGMQGGLYPCPYIEPSFAMPRVNASSGVVFIIAHSIQFRAGWETDALNFPGPFFL